MLSTTDQTARTIFLPGIARNIVSVVPSQTELLYDLGLNAEITGITKFCVHPKEWFAAKTKIGGTKELDIKAIKKLHPDLVLANKEENVKEQIEELSLQFPVWVSDVSNPEDAYQMIRQIGMLTGTSKKANDIVKEIVAKFTLLNLNLRKIRTAYLIWKDPYMTVGGDTFIHAMMQQAGFENIFADRIRYPAITIEEVQRRNCEVLLLSSEPFPFKQKHIDELQPQLPGSKIMLADGEMFSWYGSRMLLAPSYFRQLSDHIRSIVP